MSKGRQFKLARKGKDITMVEVADHLGVSQSFISRFENGKRAMNDTMMEQYEQFLNDYIIEY